MVGVGYRVIANGLKHMRAIPAIVLTAHEGQSCCISTHLMIATEHAREARDNFDRGHVKGR